jgi:hypothetical protein
VVIGRLRSLRHESGQTIAIFALALTGLLGMCALTIDVGAWYLANRRLQDATDEAALAGATMLPGSAESAAALAITQGNRNFSDGTFVATSNYKGDPNKLQVTGSAAAPLFFAKIFGIGSIRLHARAAAMANPPTGGGAVFAGDTTCGQGHELLIRVNNFNSTGAVMTMGSIDAQWSGTHGQITYGGPNNCAPVGGTAGGTVDRTNYPWPEPHVTSEFCPTPMPAAGNITITNGQSGVVCTTGNINVPTGVTANVTMVGNRIIISDHNMHLTPFQGNVLAFATGNQTAPGTGAIDINGNNMTLAGTLYAPFGRIIINGNTGVNASAFLEGLQVELDGNSWTLTGSGTSDPGTYPTMIE